MFSLTDSFLAVIVIAVTVAVPTLFKSFPDSCCRLPICFFVQNGISCHSYEGKALNKVRFSNPTAPPGQISKLVFKKT